MTLIEVIVTVALIAIVVVPLGTVLVATYNASSANASRQNAAILATSVLSHLETTAYGDVGFTAAQLNTITSGAGSNSLDAAYGATAIGGSYYFGSDATAPQLVTVATAPAFTLGSAATPFGPIMTGVDSGGTVYTVVTHAVYATATVPACPGYTPAQTALPGAYVRVYVKVSWSNGTIGGEQLTEDGVIYPGGLNPYRGSGYDSSAVPPAPGGVTAKASSSATTGAITVSWQVPVGWSSSADSECFAVGWADANGVESSTGMVANNDPALTMSGSTASYTVSSLDQGGAFVFYVTAFSPNGVESAESTDAPTAYAPTGPVITSVSPSSGASGTKVTLTGTGFVAGMQVQFCPSGGTCPSSAATWLTPSCTSATSCSLTAPAPPASVGTGVFTIMAETATGPGGAEVTSPPIAPDEFTYTPTISKVSPASGSSTGGTSVTVTGTNLYPGTGFAFGSTPVTSTVTCDPSGGYCTMTSPDPPAGTATVDVIATDNVTASPLSAADQFAY